MNYQGNFTPEQIERIRSYRKGLIEKTLAVSTRGEFVEHKGRPGNFYFVLPSVHWANEGCIPLIDNYTLDKHENVLDFGTGCGVIALDAVKKGVRFVTGLDINENAVRSSKINSILQNLDSRCLFWQGKIITNNKKTYDVITANLPFTDEFSQGIAQRAAYDQRLEAHEELFRGANSRLKQKGRIYLAQANFGAVDRALEIGREYGFCNQKLIGQMDTVWNEVPVKFYAFELRRQK